MIKGLYSAASAMLVGLARQRALSHNIANLDTPGFRQILVSIEDYLHTSVAGTGWGTSSDVIGSLGLGAVSGGEETDFSSGGLSLTSRLYDFAIEGEGFFRVQTPEGERLTRDGRFTRDSSGQLVTVDGFKVLSDQNSPIVLPEGSIVVDPDGSIFIDGDTVGRIGLAAFDDPGEDLERDGGNLFIAVGDGGDATPGLIRQGYLEGSNVDPSQALTTMVAVGRAYEAAQQLVQIQDDLLGKAIEMLGQM
jgi:flagellar basal-body rod protein FlgF